uniref:BMERB domain-containing protein n=1 Tax=Catagonus wagneri TaxID=51154 RepID=A0A8C3WYK8_9CETA
ATPPLPAQELVRDFAFPLASYPPDLRPGKMPVHTPPSQVSRGPFSPSTPIFLRRARAQGPPKEIFLHLPHGQVLERAEYCLVSPGGDGLASPRPPSSAEMASDGCQEAEAAPGDTRSIRRGPHPAGEKDRGSPGQGPSPRTRAEPGEGSTGPKRGEERGSALAAGKKSGLKKLLLTQEQKARLLDWNDSNHQGLRPEARTQPSQKSAESGRGGRVLKPVRPLLLPRAVRETPLAQGEAQEKLGTPADRAPGERGTAPPKSPLRLIASAIRRSLEPLLASSDGGRRAWAKPEPKTLPTSPPHACARSFSFRKNSSGKDWDQQSPKRDVMSRASAFFSLGSPTVKAPQSSDTSPPEPILRTYSLPTRPSKIRPAPVSPPCSKLDDVPRLLEKVSLQESLLDAARVPKKKTSLFSSLRFKDKSLESFQQESRPGKDLQERFSVPRGRGPPTANAQPPEKLVQPISSTCLGQLARPPPPPGNEAGPKHIPVRAQVTGAPSATSSTTTSSADEEFDPQPSLQSKERKTLRRRRKLEKATKQLVKQEELKRLHKAQAIQRQLEEVEERQRAAEIQGVRLEKALRGEADSGAQDEAQLLQAWFKLVLEKNKLMRYESELLIMELSLQEDFALRRSQKDENDLNEEQEILNEMMRVIEQRNKLVDCLEEQRIKEKAEDQQFENVVFSRDCQLSGT